MSKNKDAVVHAYNCGYWIDSSGNAFNVENAPIKTRVLSRNAKVKYVGFNISFFGESYPVRVHQLVAYQKYKSKINTTGIHIRHLDGNSLNNTNSNIVIGSNHDNQMDMSPKARADRAKNGWRNRPRVHDWLVIDIDRSNGMSYRQIRARHGVPLGTLSYRYSGQNDR